MKLKKFTKIVAVGSVSSALCFLSACKEDAPETTSQTDATTAPAATATVPVYIITVSGQG